MKSRKQIREGYEEVAGLDDLFKDLEKQFGEGAGRPITQHKVQKIPRVSTGLIRLDEVLGGGIPKGRIMEIFGPESSGKTSLCLQIIGEFQKSGMVAALVDAEHTFDALWAEKLGVDISKMLFHQPMSGEEALKITQRLAESGKVGLIVVDSVAALTPLAEVEGEIGEAHMGRQARLMGQALRIIVPLAAKNGCTVIFTNQIRMKMTSYGDPTTTPGGLALKFFASIRLSITREKLETGETRIGDVVKFKAIKNKTGAPYLQRNIELSYDVGFDKVKELLDIGKELGIFTVSGTWWKYGEISIGQGEVKAHQWLTASPETQELILNKVLDKTAEVS